MSRKIVAQHILNRLVEAETSSGHSMAAAAELVAAIVRGGETVGAAAPFVQPALERAMAAANATFKARSELVAAHAELEQIKRIVLPNVAIGGAGNKDPHHFGTPTGADAEPVAA